MDVVIYKDQTIALAPYGSGESGVTGVAVGEDFVIVRFRNNPRDTYVYTHEKPGAEQVERMKWIMRKGSGLTTYINKHVQDYAERLS